MTAKPKIVCAECGKLFKPVTVRAVFCSDACRMKKANRRRTATDREAARLSKLLLGSVHELGHYQLPDTAAVEYARKLIGRAVAVGLKPTKRRRS